MPTQTQTIQTGTGLPATPLAALLLEMQALMGILPVRAPASDPFAGLSAEEAARSADAAVEAGFDNMPV